MIGMLHLLSNNILAVNFLLPSFPAPGKLFARRHQANGGIHLQCLQWAACTSGNQRLLLSITRRGTSEYAVRVMSPDEEALTVTGCGRICETISTN